MSKESPVSAGNDAYVDLDRQVSKLCIVFIHAEIEKINFRF